MSPLRFLPLLCCIALAEAAEPLRITQLRACGDLLDDRQAQFCLDTRGLSGDGLRVQLGDQRLADDRVQRDGQRLVLRLPRTDFRSAPLRLLQGERRSNPVWLSAGRSQVLAAGPDEVAKNADGLTTYLKLIAVLIEENYDGLEEARRLAKRYDAEVVGAIPPLNVFQLRLPVRNLTERDALLLRLGSEASVDAVIIEESAPEPLAEDDQLQLPKQPKADEWIANRVTDAVHYYRQRLESPKPLKPVRIGIIEREVDFDAADFRRYLDDCPPKGRTCVYARDAARPDGHGSTVTGILAADFQGDGGNRGLLQALDGVGPGFEVIVERNSDAGILANVAASVNLVEDGVRLLNWSWGIHRIGTRDLDGDELDSLVRSGLAMGGYEELLEEFFLWLHDRHPQVLVVNSAGNGAARSGRDEYRLPSSFITDQLLVVGGHQRNPDEKEVDDPDFVVRRQSSNLDARVDLMAAACVRASRREKGARGEVHCGTSYATPLVTAVVAAMLSINPELTPEQLRILLRRSALTIDTNRDLEPADAQDLTAPILPSERGYELEHPDVGRSARLDARKALELARESLDRVR